ncbi:MAG: protein translocase subunit SecD [Chloroflexi bacterium]|nr:protein translocase subunit SecD [Chloroflexota bacterium]
MTHQGRWLVFIVLLTAFALWVSLPDTTGFELDFNNDGTVDFALNVQQSLGLDLVGGLRVLLEAELPPGSFTTEDLRETANNVARRVNALGVTEPTVQVQGNNRILVELPGVTDPDQAIETIRQTALLEFIDMSGLGGRIGEFVDRRVLTSQQFIIQQQRIERAEQAGEDPATVAPQEPGAVNPLNGQPFQTVMTGGGLQAAAAELDPGGGWLISFQLTPEGGQIFGPYTASALGQSMGIVLDGVLLSAPTIQARLDTGGVITGNFTEDEARQLALQLRSGALPIPLRIESNTTVGASLGQESVNLSIRAGVIGVIIVLLFMVTYYRVPGISAALALIIFILLNFAVFKLVPITLTLPAITGFLISIGTAVDGNILIFERIKEELRAGKSLDAALDSGFDRAWQSIRDSNISTIIIAGILFLFGQTPGASIVSGFAITLALGLTLNLFTAVIVTRTFLTLLIGVFRQPLVERRWLLGV